jgi:pentose-5-phosphate-3-epimerase
MRKLLTPSIAAYRGGVRESALFARRSGCERIHVDLSVGRAVTGFPNYGSFGPKERGLFVPMVDFHLFEFGPQNGTYDLPLREEDRVIIHLFPNSSGPRTEHLLQDFLDRGMSVGLALDVETPVAEVLPYLELTSTLLVMGIPVGGRRLPLNNRVFEVLGDIRASRQRPIEIGIDGGVNAATFQALGREFDYLVVGSLLFDSADTPTRWFQLNNNLHGGDNERV